MRRTIGLASFAPLVAWVAHCTAATIRVGPGQAHLAPCAAFAAAQDGDTVEVDSAGSYAGDVCAVTKNRLTIRGVGAGRARIDAAGRNAQGKAIWVVQGQDTVIENIEFTGAAVPDANGAGIRQEGKNLTVRRCLFRDNQEGILAGDVAGSEILIEHSEFDHNGAGDGYSHNLYINHVAKLTFRYNYSHRASVGHLLKTRAAENYILYNRLTGESDGTQSYEVDCPNGGRTYIIGNIIEQAALTENPSLVGYLEEGVHASNPSDALFVVNNSFINHLGRGTFLNIGTATKTPALVINNVFFGGGTDCTQATAQLLHNLQGGGSCFVAESSFDFHLLPGSPCVDGGGEPGDGMGFSLTPTDHYVHPAASSPRPLSGALDVGAYELEDGNIVGAGGNPGVVVSNGGTSASGGTLATALGGTANGSAGVTGLHPARAQAGCSCRSAGSGTGRYWPVIVGALGAAMLTRRWRRVTTLR
jgi:hypothetical protein